MDRQEILKHFTNKLNEMIEANEFWAIYFQDPFSICNEKEIPFPVRFGISRGVYIDDSFPYIIKWQLTGDDQECSHEEYVYNQACGCNLEQYFAEPLYLGVYCRDVNTFSMTDYSEMSNDSYYPKDNEFNATIITMENFGYERASQHISIQLWAYPRAHTYPWAQHDIKSVKISDEICYDVWRRPVAQLFTLILGEEKAFELYKFLEDYEVNDVHELNVMELDGHPIITDYAGVIV